VSKVINAKPIEFFNTLELKELIFKKINALLPLPKTIIEIEKLRREDDIDSDELLKIIESDPMIVANILRVSNSAMYGFSSQIKTVKHAISMLGFKLILNIAFSTAINNYLKPDLSSYDVNIEEFTNISSVQCRIIEKWTEPKIRAIKNDLQLAAFLQEVGKIIISMIVIENNFVETFRNKILESGDIEKTETDYLHLATSEVTALVFTHWNLNPKLIEYIKYADKPNEAPEEYKNSAYALKIAKTLSPISKDNFTQQSIDKAKALSQE
jgi:HD-like signal output (HDOD) protein